MGTKRKIRCLNQNLLSQSVQLNLFIPLPKIQGKFWCSCHRTKSDDMQVSESGDKTIPKVSSAKNTWDIFASEKCKAIQAINTASFLSLGAAKIKLSHSVLQEKSTLVWSGPQTMEEFPLQSLGAYMCLSHPTGSSTAVEGARKACAAPLSDTPHVQACV